jgi:prepilin peptidase CpaA
MNPLALSVLALYAGILLWTAAIDAQRFVIPNRLVLALVAAFAVAGPLLLPLDMIPRHLGAGVVVLGVGLLLFRFRLLGGGDVKLFAAVAVWIGLNMVLILQLLFVILAGGVLSLLLLAARTRLGRELVSPLLAAAGVSPRLLDKGAPVPYAIAICIGSLAVVPWMPVFRGSF